MLPARSRLLLFKLTTTAVLALTVTGIGRSAIVDMGELAHFNCRSQTSRVLCELTHEPLIGNLQTLHAAKTDLIRTRVQSKNDVIGRPISRLVLVTGSQGELPLTHNWSRSANGQLFAQRDQIDRFLNTSQSETLNVRTYRPGQLWVVLGGLGIISIVGIRLWLPKPRRPGK
ncbi:MAG: hypothetical protein KME13_21200 [Myxacorys californica WJT36-NPBG1]|jgi:hypothetical protein|nr:hypothetical protein [Myxacorys californica WJT36-NPBG1]